MSNTPAQDGNLTENVSFNMPKRWLRAKETAEYLRCRFTDDKRIWCGWWGNGSGYSLTRFTVPSAMHVAE